MKIRSDSTHPFRRASKRIDAVPPLSGINDSIFILFSPELENLKFISELLMIYVSALLPLPRTMCGWNRSRSISKFKAVSSVDASFRCALPSQVMPEHGKRANRRSDFLSRLVLSLSSVARRTRAARECIECSDSAIRLSRAPSLMRQTIREMNGKRSVPLHRFARYTRISLMQNSFERKTFLGKLSPALVKTRRGIEFKFSRRAARM